MELTKRQTRVVELMGAGLTIEAIGLNLSISPRTVQKHVESIRARLGLKTTYSLAAQAGTMMMAGELMATLESLLNYCTNLEVKREAQKRLAELELKYKVLT